MYEELVTALRKRAAELPEKFSKNAENIDLFLKAADAIEELQGRAKVLEKVADKWCETVPKWIPVTERLPNPTFAREWYLVALESGCVQTLAFEKGSYSFEFDKAGFSNSLFQPGWHETASPVTHWMPLPEPPKEET